MDTPEPSTLLKTIRSEDFAAKYSNHVQFELSAWDLKLLFGQLDQSLGMNTVVQHTAITFPWPQVKVMMYLLQINLAVHEQLNGRVPVAGGVIPPPEAIKAGSEQFRDSAAIEKLMLEYYNAFIKHNPEAAKDWVMKKPANKSTKK